MAAVFKFSLFNQTGLNSFTQRNRLKCLDARFFIKGNSVNMFLFPLWSKPVSFTDISATLIKSFIIGSVDPTLNLIGTNIGLILKSARLGVAR